MTKASEHAHLPGDFFMTSTDPITSQTPAWRWYNDNPHYQPDKLPTGGITNFAANLFNIDITGFQNTHNGNFSITQNGNNLDLVYTAVPEPRAALLGGLGLLVLLRRRRHG